MKIYVKPFASEGGTHGTIVHNGETIYREKTDEYTHSLVVMWEGKERVVAVELRKWTWRPLGVLGGKTSGNSILVGAMVMVFVAILTAMAVMLSSVAIARQTIDTTVAATVEATVRTGEPKVFSCSQVSCKGGIENLNVSCTPYTEYVFCTYYAQVNSPLPKWFTEKVYSGQVVVYR